MAMHELTTNALKYGALSVLGGVLRVNWTVEGTRLGNEMGEVQRPYTQGSRRRSDSAVNSCGDCYLINSALSGLPNPTRVVSRSGHWTPPHSDCKAVPSTVQFTRSTPPRRTAHHVQRVGVVFSCMAIAKETET